MDPTYISELKIRLANMAADAEVLEIPTHAYDGTEVKSAEQVAAILGIPVTEAVVRMERKDVYSGEATHAVGVGVGTRVDDCGVIPRKKRRRKKRPTTEEDA